MKIAYVFFNGVMDTNEEFYKELLKDKNDIFCADGGLKYAIELGVKPLELWGDLDSIDEKYIEKAKELNIKIMKFDPHKDFTDGELIVDNLKKRGYDKIIVLGGLGGRTDHLLSNLNLLFKYDDLVYVSEKEILFKVDYYTEIKNQKGKTISFIPMSDSVEGLTLTGFEYPLDNQCVKRGDSLCTSNVITDDVAKVRFEVGKLLGVLISSGLSSNYLWV